MKKAAPKPPQTDMATSNPRVIYNRLDRDFRYVSKSGDTMGWASTQARAEEKIAEADYRLAQLAGQAAQGA